MRDRHRSLVRIALGVVAAVLAVATVASPVAAQSRVVGDGAPALSAALRFGVPVATNLLVGAILLAFAPRFTESTLVRARESATLSVVVGLLVTVALGVALGVVAVLPVVSVLAIPLGVVVLAVGLAGSACGAIGVGSAVAGAVAGAESRWAGLTVGAFLLGLVGMVPILGGLVAGVVGAAGVGGLCLRIYRGQPVRRRSMERLSDDPF